MSKHKEKNMKPCEVCGNVYDKSFEVRMGEKSYVFDSFECAIQALAPVCCHCKCKILGHGVENDAAVYCCAHCARQEEVSGFVDRQ